MGTPPPRAGEDGGPILVLRPDNRLGNLILVTPLLDVLRRSFPRRRIALYAGARFADLVVGDPRIDEVLTVSGTAGGARRPGSGLVRLRTTGWGVCLSTVFPGANSTTATLLAAWSRAGVRIGFDHPRSRASLTRAVPLPPDGLHATTALLSLLEPIAGRVLDDAPAPGLPGLNAGGRPLPIPEAAGASGALRICLHTGGRGDKGWSLPAFRSLARGLAGQGHEVWVAEGPDAPGWPPETGKLPIRLLPRLTVRQFAGALARVDRFVGCDSGAMHLAAAVGTPVTALFRRSDPRRYAPVGASHEVLVLGDASERFLDRGGWTSLHPSRAPALRTAPSGVRERPPEGQVPWVLDAVLAVAARREESPRGAAAGSP